MPLEEVKPTLIHSEIVIIDEEGNEEPYEPSKL
jgi:hypothetical protein